MAMSTTLFLLCCASLIKAQSNMVPVTWSSIIYTYYGEITPMILNAATPILTPLGASQLYNSGSIIRDRYLNSNATELTLGLPINGLSDRYIVNNQLQVWSTSDEYVVGSAQAFMQGLYPPVTEGQGTNSILANGSVINYPLDGYQYPDINSMSEMDYNYIWIAGNDQCTTYDIARTVTKLSPNSTSLMASTEDFYLSLANTFFAGIDSSMLNYGNAIDLYYYALYQYNHNSSIYNMINAFGLLETLNGFASEQALSFNTPITGSGIQDIAGQTFASKVIQQFQQTISSSGVSDKLSLYFGSYEPMLSFFYLSALSTSDLTGSHFSTLPDHGSMMGFELFSYVEEGQSDSSIPFPNTTDLWFGEEDDAFKGVNGVVGGIIGAVVTLVVVMLVGLVLALLGFRMRYREKNMPASVGGGGFLKRGAGGGFKGPEKLASDTDVNVVRASGSGSGAAAGAGAAVKHERVGSWEMGNTSGKYGSKLESREDRERGGELGHENVGHERVVSTADYSRRSEDGIGSHDPWGKGVEG